MTLAHGLIAIQFAAISVAAARLLYLRVRIPVFIAFLIFDLAAGVASLWAQSSGSAAVTVWAYSQLLTAAWWIAAFVELRIYVLERYPRIGSTGTFLTVAAIVVGLILVLATAQDQRNGLMRLAMFAPRIVAGVLFVSMGVLGILMRHYPTDHTPNIARHAWILWLYFGAKALSFWAVNVGANPQLMSMIGLVLGLICFGSWATLMEREIVRPWLPTMTADELRAAQARSERALDELRDFSG